MKRFYNTGLRIGLLGGSFNPPHNGHLELSKVAIKNLNLDFCVWIVAYHNNLKPSYSVSGLERAKMCKSIIDHERILVSSIEFDMRFKYTYQTINFINAILGSVQLFFLCGTDVLLKFHLWERHELIATSIPICAFDRPYYRYNALFSKAFNLYKNVNIFLKRMNYESSTSIREASNLGRGPILNIKDTILNSIKEKNGQDLSIFEDNDSCIIIANGSSTKNVFSIADDISFRLKNYATVSIEGMRESRWVLLSVDNFAVHIFHPETRLYYNIDSLYEGKGYKKVL